MQTIRHAAAFVMLVLSMAAARAESAASAEASHAPTSASASLSSAASTGEQASAALPASAIASASSASVSVQDNAAAQPGGEGVVWQLGPRAVELLDQASIKLPPDYAYLDGEQARQMLRTMGNPNVDDVAGLIGGPGGDWFVVVRFQKAGYVKDDDAKDWNPDELLEALKKGTSRTNVLRRKAGSSEMEVVGWVEKPRYDTSLHRLVWAVSARSKGDKDVAGQGVNYNTFALGREGYFSLNLITGLKKIDRNKQYVSTLLSALEFKDGKNYADFESGKDKVAPYGLSTLVSGAGPKKFAFLRAFFSKYGIMLLLVILGLVAVGGLAIVVRIFMRKRRLTAAARVEPSDGEQPEVKKKA